MQTSANASFLYTFLYTYSVCNGVLLFVIRSAVMMEFGFSGEVPASKGACEEKQKNVSLFLEKKILPINVTILQYEKFVE